MDNVGGVWWGEKLKFQSPRLVGEALGVNDGFRPSFGHSKTINEFVFTFNASEYSLKNVDKLPLSMSKNKLRFSVVLGLWSVMPIPLHHDGHRMMVKII